MSSTTKIDFLNDEIIDLYDAGYSLREISNMLYISPNTVSARLVENKIRIRKKGGGYPQHFRISHQEVDRTLYLYYQTDLTIKEMGKVLGLSYSGMYSRLVRIGITPVRKVTRNGRRVRVERNSAIKTKTQT